jgi:hypothetical protein
MISAVMLPATIASVSASAARSSSENASEVRHISSSATQWSLTPASRAAGEGFATRDELVARYAEQTGRDVSAVRWYQAFALWKASVFCEAIHGRYLKGERDDGWAGELCDGVPRLLGVAEGILRRRTGTPAIGCSVMPGRTGGRVLGEATT